MSRNCAIVLHAHVPWVWNPETEHSLEEDWLHSSVLETYLPLLEMLFRLRNENVPWQLTFNISPILLAMLEDRQIKRKTLNYIDRTIHLAADEVERGEQTGHKEQAELYLEKFHRLRGLYFGQWQGDIVKALCDLRDTGHLEITASAATHGLLPLLMRVPEAVQAQVRGGVRQYVKSFGRMPHGFWLPECAYAPALGDLLSREGISWTIVEEHGLLHSPQPDESFPFQPGRTGGGLVVFGRDQTSSSQVWNADEGYPGDERYRDFMRDIGLEAPIENLKDYLGGNEQRQFTGLKYFRASRNGSESALYNRELALAAVEEHAVHFTGSRGAQLAGLEADGITDPLVMCAFDADLFGHWWFEGVDFLEKVFRKTAERNDFQFTTPSFYLSEENRIEGEMPSAAPVSSSWGEGGYFETWTADENNWVYPEIQTRAEQIRRMVTMMEENREGMRSEDFEHRRRCLQQMTRELLIAQASDWPFLMRNDPSREYAENRTREHLANFDEAWRLCTSLSGEERLAELEEKNAHFSGYSLEYV